MSVKILKNNTISDIELLDLGITIPASSQITLQPELYTDAADSDELVDYIGSGDIIVNDGNSDLRKSQGIALIQAGFIKSDVIDDLKINDRIKVDVSGTLSDGTVKVSENDASSAYLENKIVPENNKISVTTLNDGLEEDLQIGLNESNVDHDNLNNFSPNEHIDHSIVNITAGNALSGGGDITTSRTLDVVEGDIDHQNLSGAGVNTHLDIDNHISNTLNPHNVTKAQVGLSNVPNIDATDADNVTIDPTGNLTSANVQAALVEHQGDIDTINSTKQDISEKGQPNGYAGLDATGVVPLNQLPSSIYGGPKYVGTWNADTNTPNISATSPNQGDYYKVSVAGSTLLGGFSDWEIGDWAIYNGTDWDKIDNTDSGSEIDFERVIYVDLSGDDATGNGSLSFPYRTIKKAADIANALTPSDTNRIMIKVAAGTYLEDPITLNSYISLKGETNVTVIEPNNVNANLLTCSNRNELKDFILRGVTNSNNYHLIVDVPSGDGRFSVDNVRVGFGSNGFKFVSQSTTELSEVFINQTKSRGLTGDFITVSNNVKALIYNVSLVGSSTTTGLKVEDNAIVDVYSSSFKDCGIGVYTESTNETTLYSVDLREIVVPFQKVGSSKITFSQCTLYGEDALITEVSGLQGQFIDEEQGDRKNRNFDELSVGIPGQGRASNLGEGDSYTNGMLVYTFNGSTYSDVTTQAKSKSSSTFTFPGTAVDNAIYVSTQRLESGTSDPLKWFGLLHSTTVASVGGEIVGEYWNGSSWIEISHMSAEAQGQYLPYGLDIFQRTGTENVRFNSNIQNNWALNDPVSLGVNLYWFRFRIVSSLTTAPIFEQFKLHTNSTEISKDGYIQYFGNGRPLNILPFDYGSLQPATSSPGDQDLFIGDFMVFGGDENQFAAFNVDRIGLIRPLPLDLDTSYPIRIIVYIHSETGDQSPDLSWTVRWSKTNVGSSVYDSTASSPTVAVGEQSLTQTVSPPAQDIQGRFEFDLDVSNFVTRNEQNDGDLIWITLQRNNDGNNSDISIVQIELQYLKWCNGGHL